MKFTSEPYFKANTARLLREVLNNPGTSILQKPLSILGGLLYDVAERASELNDPLLNKLMCDLALYAISDQYNPEYDKEAVNKVYKDAKLFYNKNKKR